MDRILQAYGEDDDECGDEHDEQAKRKCAGARATLIPEEQNGRDRAASAEPAAASEPPIRRRPRLPDAGALLDGHHRQRKRPAAADAAAAAAAALALAPPPAQPRQQQQQQVGPPLHDGNFPYLVYVPLPTKGALADALAEIAAAAAPGVPGFEPLVGGPLPSAAAAAADGEEPSPPSSSSSSSSCSPPDVPLHISLTRAGTVRLRQAAPLVAALGRHLSKRRKGGDGAAAAAAALQPPPTASGSPPIALLGRPRAFLNDDRTRTFLVLTALDPDDDAAQATKATTAVATPRCAPALLRAIACCDAALRELGLPPYYSDGQPHVSIASAPAASHAAMEAAARRAETTTATTTTTPLLPLAVPFPPGVLCQIGKRRHVVWGEAHPSV